MTLSTTLAAPTPYPGLPRVTRAIPEQRVMALPEVPAAAPVPDIASIVARAQGDGPDAVRAMAEIYTRYQPTVRKFAGYRLRDPQDAEDITSTTFLRAQMRIRSYQYRPGTDLGAWLITIARNLIADHYKSGRYRLEVTTGDVLDADRADTDPVADPAAAALHRLSSRDIAHAVDQLSDEQRQCIVLRFLRGYSIAETAQVMDKNDGAIKALQYRATRALARLINPDGALIEPQGS